MSNQQLTGTNITNVYINYLYISFYIIDHLYIYITYKSSKNTSQLFRGKNIGGTLQGGYSEPDRGDLEAITLKEDRWLVTDRFHGDFTGDLTMKHGDLVGRFFSALFFENMFGD